MKIVIMGVQGSGKGTQAKLLSKELNLPHISTGDLFRENIGAGTELGKQARQYADRGELVPDELVIDMLTERLKQDDAKEGFLLDGFPRSAVQLAALEYIAPIEKTILLGLDDETAIRRLGNRTECRKCGILYGANRSPNSPGMCDECGGVLTERTDDKDIDAIKRRLAAYHSEIDTMVRYYRWKGVLCEVDAAGTVEEVLKTILAGIRD